MLDRVDLSIAVIGVVVSVVGSSTGLWVAISKKADKHDLARVETRLEARIDAVEGRLGAKSDGLEARMGAGLGRVEAKLDSLILRMVPEQSPQAEN